MLLKKGNKVDMIDGEKSANGEENDNRVILSKKDRSKKAKEKILQTLHIVFFGY